MAFREGLKEWWNDPEKFWTGRFPNAFYRRRTMRETLWFMVGIGFAGAFHLDLAFFTLGLIGAGYYVVEGPPNEAVMGARIAIAP
jgi:hypothetical protein